MEVILFVLIIFSVLLSIDYPIIGLGIIGIFLVFCSFACFLNDENEVFVNLITGVILLIIGIFLQKNLAILLFNMGPPIGWGLLGVILALYILCLIGLLSYIFDIINNNNSFSSSNSNTSTHTNNNSSSNNSTYTPTNTTSKTTISPPKFSNDINSILVEISKGEIKDIYSQETFKPGDKVYFCSVHQLAYHEDSWQELKQCTVCGHSGNTKLYILPNSTNLNGIQWKDDDVYKPIPKNITEFLEERNFTIEHKKVYIKEEAFETIKSHLKSNLRVAQGGILFGNAYKDETLGIYVEINVAVPAPATIGSGSHLEFPSDSWMKIMDFARKEHPEENIVGWYHSHPNLGVFMSGTDMRTQQAFFYHPWCLSIVHDPVRRDTGFFLGKNATKITPFFYSNLK